MIPEFKIISFSETSLVHFAAVQTVADEHRELAIHEEDGQVVFTLANMGHDDRPEQAGFTDQEFDTLHEAYEHLALLLGKDT